MGFRPGSLEGVVSAGTAIDGFWRNKRVLVTGHTGFKGAWLCLMLHALGAEVAGLALEPAEPSAFDLLGVSGLLRESLTVDIRDPHDTRQAIRRVRPEIVFHLAAQALVGEGVRNPGSTYAVNACGTVNVIEGLRGLAGVKAALFVTSDKVYSNDDCGRPFRESDPLGGGDPYSVSKAAAEFIVSGWSRAFGKELPPMATARAGNVLGGGDFGTERLVPDLVRALAVGRPLVLRSPDATRPFQYVLDVLRGYLMYARMLAQPPGNVPRALNFGPRDGEIRVRDLLELWGDAVSRPVRWETDPGPHMTEMRRLSLVSVLAARTLGWRPLCDTRSTVARTALWYEAWSAQEDMAAYSKAEVQEFLHVRGGWA